MIQKRFFNRLMVGLASGAVLIFNSCSKDDVPVTPVTDYSIPGNWLNIPAQDTFGVDVFYLYPTAYNKGANSNDPDICAVDNSIMRKGAYSAYNRTATAFSTVGNIYAPFYRQADAQYIFGLSADSAQMVIGDIPASDAIAAFDYYLKNYNKGRPFILAGHSQGSNILLFLLSDYLRNNPAYERMIAAYVIGYTVTDKYLNANPPLKFASGSDDQGVIISYNTEAADAINNPVVLPEALCINPISWTRGTATADTSEGLGSYLPDHTGKFIKVPQYADATISTTASGAKVIVCKTANENEIAIIDSLSGFPLGVYHSFDYPFYYFNIRENAANRVKRYLNR